MLHTWIHIYTKETARKHLQEHQFSCFLQKAFLRYNKAFYWMMTHPCNIVNSFTSRAKISTILMLYIFGNITFVAGCRLACANAFVISSKFWKSVNSFGHRCYCYYQWLFSFPSWVLIHSLMLLCIFQKAICQLYKTTTLKVLGLHTICPKLLWILWLAFTQQWMWQHLQNAPPWSPFSYSNFRFYRQSNHD